ncbi:MAG: NTP transferase domain-containing protein [Oscillospiraceae bacterium]|nr:NTP transferase domain-containing protein [Oscillospiraceae bacterium]
MKAVILAHGSTRRLQPVCGNGPKAAVAVLDRTVLEHLLHWLGSHGVKRTCIVCSADSRDLRRRCDGKQPDMELVWVETEERTGTAGGVAVCRRWLDGEETVVVSGDMVTDMDLTGAAAFHREKKALATILIHPHHEPPEHSLVLTDGAGRVTAFVNRPGWGETVSDTVSTGVYILSPAAVEQLGAEQELERDVFPGMAAEKQALYAVRPDGAWCWAGDCEAYLGCCADVVGGKVKLDMGLELIQPGIWASQPVPEGVTLIPPCWIGPGVELGAGCLIGPHVILGEGSRVGARSLVQRCVLNGAQVGERATLYGAVLGRNARVGDRAVVNDGAVLGENALVGDGAILMERVRLWSGNRVAPGVRVRHSPARGGSPEPLRFGDGGIIRGLLGEELTADNLLALGGVLAREGKVGIGSHGGPGAQMLLRSAISGITAAGGQALCHDMECAAQAAWLAESCQLPVSLFIEQEGERVFLHLFDSGGLPPVPNWQRRVEHALAHGLAPSCTAAGVGQCDKISCGPREYFRDGARRCALRRMGRRPLTVAAPGTTAPDRALRGMLEELGCAVTDRWKPGVPEFRASHGGFLLTARDERGATLSPQQLLAMAALVELEHGGGRLAVPDDASAAVELVAAGFGKTVRRLGRDGEAARQLYRTLPWLRDAAFAATRLCACMTATGQRLEQLAGKTPRFSGWRREVTLTGDRAAVMARLSEGLSPDCRVGEGLRLRDRGGWVYLVPLARRCAVRVVAESDDMELAAELCDFYAGRVAEADREQGTK